VTVYKGDLNTFHF